jgi:2-aminoethylphosphonate-pyruvate transaminase
VRNLYLRLQKHIDIAESHRQTPNTPAVVMFNTFLASVDELLEEGVKNRVGRYTKNRNLIREGVQSLGLKVLQDEEVSSSCVTSVFLPENINMDSFLDEMENEGYIFYNGKGPFIKMNMFQIANMGQIFSDDVKKMLIVLKDVLFKCGFKVPENQV